MNRRDFVVQALAAGAMASGSPARAQANGRYTGYLDLRPLSVDGRFRRVLHAYGYVDPRGRRWPVPAGTETDGASIPPLFWPIIGKPFDGPYRNAAVIHDWYCMVRARTWQDTHRVFHDAMLTSGVDRIRASTMFMAVWYRGPSWDEMTRRTMARLTNDGKLSLPPQPPPPPPPPMTEQEAREQAARDTESKAQFLALKAQIERDQLTSPAQIENLVERVGGAEPAQ